MNKSYIYIFTHIPRSAGTTFVKHIEKNYKPEERLRLYWHELELNKYGYDLEYSDYKRIISKHIKRFPKERLRKLKVIYGHRAYYGIHDLFDKDVRYITFIRDPIKRVVSMYNFWMTSYNSHLYKSQMKMHKDGFLVDEKVPDFNTWLNAKLENSNIHTIAITLKRFFRKLGYLDSDISNKSLRSLFDKFYFVGTSQTYDDDSLYLFDELKINKFFIGQNISKKYFKVDDKREEKMLKRLYKDSYRIYNNAIKKNLEFKNETPDFYKVVEQMKKKRKLVLPFSSMIYDFPKMVKISLDKMLFSKQ